MALFWDSVNIMKNRRYSKYLHMSMEDIKV